MEDRTKEFLDRCKEAGYERVTIFVADKRIPLSVKIKKQSTEGPGATGTYWGNPIMNVPFKVICGSPERTGACPGLPSSEWPSMWGIVKRFGLTAGLQSGGSGSGNAHDVHPTLVGMLKAGYYDLSTNE